MMHSMLFSVFTLYSCRSAFSHEYVLYISLSSLVSAVRY